MSILTKLASAQNRRDEVLNIELARDIMKRYDRDAVKELVDNLTNKNKSIQSDCIKTLYEIAYLEPKLLSSYVDAFLALLANKNNRMVWGAMIALDMITFEQPEKVYQALPALVDFADTGSVITRDHVVGILIKLASIKKYTGNVFPLLIHQLQICPLNQLPMYAEQAENIIEKNNREEFTATLTKRLKEEMKESKRKRIEKTLKKVSSIV